jgi:hypothetical protein
MPLTSVCDGDVMAKCNVDKQVTPFLMSGYIQVCTEVLTLCSQPQSAAAAVSLAWVTC